MLADEPETVLDGGGPPRGASPLALDSTATVLIEGASKRGSRPAGPAPRSGASKLDPLFREFLDRLPRRPGQPPKLGRFTILRALGSGGMGLVLSAYDDDLDRKVAIKVLHRRGALDSTEGRATILREAHAMARLSHPNVVPIYEAGELGGQIYLVMEFVRGGTLRAWTKGALETGSSAEREARSPPGWREIVTMYIAAGRGLAAAHEAGLVHRDFKPAHVLIGEDGRVCVLDFGLAREGGASEVVVGAAGSISGSDQSLLRMELTAANSAIGTPAYMPIEQIESGTVTPRSDIFSFCVTLHEALYGERPFKGRTPRVLYERIRRGERARPEALTRAPIRLYRVLERGLSLDPEARWSSMDELLAALERDPARTLLRLGVALLILAALVVITALVSGRSGPAICRDRGDVLVDVWDEDRSRELYPALTRAGGSYSEHAAARVRERLDAYAREFEGALEQTCRASDLSSASALVPVHCLELRREELRALTAGLTSADEDMVLHAFELVEALHAPAECLDARRLRARAPYPEDEQRAAEVVRLRGELARARNELKSGHYGGARASALALEREITAVDYPPLLAEFRLLQGMIEASDGEVSPAIERFDEAYRSALAAGHDETAITALTRAAVAYGRVMEHKLGMHRALDAGAMLTRLGLDEGEPNELLVDQALAVGYVYMRTHGRAEEAYEQLSRALAQAERLYPADSLKLARPLYLLAQAELITKRLEDSLAHAQRAFTISRETHGEGHPNLASPHNTLGLILKNMDRHEEAVEHLKKSIEIIEASRGVLHADALMAHSNLARTYVKMQRFDDAERHSEIVVKISMAEDGEDSMNVANARSELAKLYLRQGKTAEARALLERAHREFRRRRVPNAMLQLATIDLLLGELTLKAGEASAARVHYAGAVRSLMAAARDEPLERARARFGYARALWLDKQRDQALREARVARSSLAEVDGESEEKLRARIDRWIAARG